jgi:hypothetical protein
MSKTPEERAAFGAKMTAARAAKREARANSPEEGKVEMTAEKKFAGPEDVPAGVRPIKPRATAGGVKDIGEIAGLTQAPDTGYAAPSGGAAIEVSSDQVIGGGSGTAAPSFGPANQGTPAKPGLLFSDKAAQPGEAQRQTAPRRGSGRAEPTGLPCTCIIPTYLMGEDPAITWCVNCGGERDGIARPENSLKRREVREAMDSSGVTLSIEAIVEQVSARIDYGAIAAEVVKQLSQQTREK